MIEASSVMISKHSIAITVAILALFYTANAVLSDSTPQSGSVPEHDDFNNPAPAPLFKMPELSSGSSQNSPSINQPNTNQGQGGGFFPSFRGDRDTPAHSSSTGAPSAGTPSFL